MKHPNLINISCECHSLNLGINDARSNHEEFEYHCSNIEHFVHLFSFKKIVSKLHLSCPDICQTRWTNMCDICLWIVKHHLEIVSFVLEKGKSIDIIFENIETIAETIYVSAPLLVLLLISFKKLSETLENDHISMSNLFGFEQSALLTARQVTTNCQKVYELNCKIEDEIKKRLEHSKSGAYQYLLFSLTPKGKVVDTLLRMNESEKLNDFLIESFPIQLSQYSKIIDESINILNKCIILDLSKDDFVKKVIDEGNCFMEEEEEEEEYESNDDSYSACLTSSDDNDEENQSENDDFIVPKKYQETYFLEEELENDIPFEIESFDQSLLIDLLSNICDNLSYDHEKVISAYIQWFTNQNFKFIII